MWECFHLSRYFNPRSPCGERPERSSTSLTCRVFQSTLPMRGATRFSNSAHLPFQFQSTLPMRGATYAVGIIVQAILISIHAPHAGSDAALPVELQGHINFNPRSPCGERLDANGFETVEPISIHAPHAGSDILDCTECKDLGYFNPRSPCGERPCPPQAVR